MFDFLKRYVKNPSKVGAIAPSGQGLTMKMMEPVDFEKAKCIVEYGPGTGAFTGELIKRKKPETRLILIEQDDWFYELMEKNYGSDPSVTVVHGTAERADRILMNLGIHHADFVVSGLPFTSLPKDVSKRIFWATDRIIGRRGVFVTFQYTLVKKKFFEKYFRFEDILFEWKNLPPAYVFVLRRPE